MEKSEYERLKILREAAAQKILLEIIGYLQKNIETEKNRKKDFMNLCKKEDLR